MADLFGILKNKALLMTLSKDEIQTLLDTLESSMNQGDASALTQAKSYTDQKIAELPAGGLYQPISEFHGSFDTTASNVDFYDYIDPDADMVYIKIVLRGSLTFGTSFVRNTQLALGFSTANPEMIILTDSLSSGSTFNITSQSPWPRFECFYRFKGEYGFNSSGTISSYAGLYAGDDMLPQDAEVVERNLYIWYRKDANSTWSRAPKSQISECDLTWSVTVRNYSLEG